MRNTNKLTLLFLIALLGSSCTITLKPQTEDLPNYKNEKSTQKKVVAKLGVYIPKDLQQYTFTAKKFGFTGKADLVPYIDYAADQLIHSVGEDAIKIDSLPPYINNKNIPDIDAVFEVTIDKAYAQVTGTIITGQIITEFGGTGNLYDMSGEIIHKESFLRNHRSDTKVWPVEFIENFGNIFKIANNVGSWGAAKAAEDTIKLRDELLAAPPEIFREYMNMVGFFDNIKQRYVVDPGGSIKIIFEQGKQYFDKEDFSASLFFFRKALTLFPADNLLQFYFALSNFKVGNILKAKKIFNGLANSVDNKNNIKKYSLEWVNRFENPVKVKFVVTNNTKYSNDTVMEIIDQSFKNSGIYTVDNIVFVGNDDNPFEIISTELNNCKNSRLLLSLAFSESHALSVNKQQYNDGDVAENFAIDVSANLYSVRKKHNLSRYNIESTTTMINDRSREFTDDIYHRLFQRDCNRLIVKMIQGDFY